MITSKKLLYLLCILSSSIAYGIVPIDDTPVHPDIPLMMEGYKGLNEDVPLTREHCINTYWHAVESMPQHEKDKRCTILDDHHAGNSISWQERRRAIAAAIFTGVDTNSWDERLGKKCVNRSLFFAVLHDDCELVELLFANGVSPYAVVVRTNVLGDSINVLGDSLVFNAIRSSAIAQIFFNQDSSFIHLRFGKSGNTLLAHTCVNKRPAELGEWYIAKGIDVHATNNMGCTPLHELCQHLNYAGKESYSRILSHFKVVLRAGADFDLEDNLGEKPLEKIRDIEIRSLVVSLANIQNSRKLLQNLSRDASSLCSTMPRDIVESIHFCLRSEIDGLIDKEIEKCKNEVEDSNTCPLM